MLSVCRPRTSSTLSLHDALPISVYVPLDPHAPARRVVSIADDCGVRALITTAERLRTLPPRATACTVLVSGTRSEEHTSELQSRRDLVCRLLREKKTAPHSLPRP